MTTLERLQWQIAGAGGAAEALGINLRSRMQKLGIRGPAPGAPAMANAAAD